MKRTLAGDMQAAHGALVALWGAYKDALVPVSNAAILVALIALLGFLGDLYLFR